MSEATDNRPSVIGAAAGGDGRPTPGGARGYLRARIASGFELQLVVAIAALWIALALTVEGFGTISNLQNMALVGGVLAIVTLGQMFPLVVGGFDISVGATMGFASVVGGEVMLDHGVEAGIVAGVLAGAVVGVVNGGLVTVFRLSPFIVTLGMLTFLAGLTNQLINGVTISGFPEGFRAFGADYVAGIPSSAVIAVVIAIGVAIVLSFTRPGLYLYAIGGSRDASMLSGLSVARHEFLAYVVCGMLAGTAGMVLASQVGIGQAGLGAGYELQAIAAAVVGGVAIGGGRGRVLGAVLGVALLTVLTTGLSIAGASSFVQQMFTGVVVIAAVIAAQIRGASLRRLLIRRSAGPLPSEGPEA